VLVAIGVGALLVLGGAVFGATQLVGSDSNSASPRPVTTTSPPPPPPASSRKPAPTFPATQAEVSLYAHIPKSERRSCKRDDKPVDGAAGAAAECTLRSNGVYVFYEYFRAHVAMQDAYDTWRRNADVSMGAGSCPESLPSEGSYNIGSTKNVGRRICYRDDSGYATTVWTDRRFRILSWAFVFKGRFVGLNYWWRKSSGPVP
jgi:hypothetical protein